MRPFPVNIFALLLLFFIMVAASASSGEEASAARQMRVNEYMKQVVKLLEERQYGLAVPVLKKALAVDPSNKEAAEYLSVAEQMNAEPYCAQALEAFVQEDYDRAIGLWENALQIVPGDRRIEGLVKMAKGMARDNAADTMLVAAEKFFGEKKYEEAIGELDKLLLVAPENGKAKQLLASIKKMMFDTRMKEHYEAADKYLKQKEYDLAIAEWNKILALDSGQESAVRFISNVQRLRLEGLYEEAGNAYKTGDYLGARDLYLKIASDNPKDQEVKKLIVRLNEVITVAMVIKDEGDVWDLTRKSIMFHINDRPRAAIAAAWYAAQLDPENAAILAVRDFIERNNISTMRTMEPPVKDMNIIDQYMFAVLNHIYEGRYDLAIEKCNLVLELQPQNVVALKRLGSAYFSLGEKEKAREAWNKALKLLPDDKDLQKYIKETK